MSANRQFRRYGQEVLCQRGQPLCRVSESALQQAKHAHSGQFVLHKHLAACTEEHKEGLRSVHAEIMCSASLLLQLISLVL